MSGGSTEAPVRRGVVVTCPLGGPAPCLDDMCHGGGTTLCGLEWDFDFCEHGYDPDTCPECQDAEDEFAVYGFGTADDDERKPGA